MKISRTVVGVDTAKRVFQLYWVDMETGEIVDLRLTRTKFLEHFANRAPCLVALEACGGSQHWGRRLRELGHEVRLLPAKMVRPFVGGNKNDAHDATRDLDGGATTRHQDGCDQDRGAAGDPGAAPHAPAVGEVPHRADQLPARPSDRNMARSCRRAGPVCVEAWPRPSLGSRSVCRRWWWRPCGSRWARVSRLDEEIGEIERRLKLWHRDNVASRRIAAIPGVGVLTATAAVAMMGDPAAFRSGREFAAWLGLVPRHSGTGGRVRMLGISKRGDTYLRTLLIHGARSVLTTSKSPPEWASCLAERRPANVAAVALANKTARTIWALLAHDRTYRPNFVSQPG